MAHMRDNNKLAKITTKPQFENAKLYYLFS